MAEQTEQSAVEWLNENNIIICESFLYDKIRQSFVEQLINCFKINLEQAKQMEKEQIGKAYYDGYYDAEGQGLVSIETQEQYYNDKYKTQAQ